MSQLIVSVYVDDLTITGYEPDDILAFKEDMKNVFKMSDLGPLSYYLCIEVDQGRHGIKLSQRAYTDKLLERSGMLDCNGVAALMKSWLKMGKQSNTLLVNAMESRCIIGALHYLVNTRPDLAFVVLFLSRFMEEPHDEHLAAVKRVLWYIAGTRCYGVHYKRGGDDGTNLIGYSDVDLAGDIAHHKSTSDVIFFLGNNPITWQSAKQKVVALSSCEAEYITAAIASCQGV